MHKMKLFFSDYFGVKRDVIEKYGAIDISLISDIPLFIDPFLIFHSSKPEYQKLHSEIIRYLVFLKSKVASPSFNLGELKAWFVFPEVTQNWLGYSFDNNQGRGLRLDFAKKLYKNLGGVLNNFGDEIITKSPHFEKLCLLEKGVGRDKISDFAVNLTKAYLLEYTEIFAKKYLKQQQLVHLSVNRSIFDYKLEKWMPREYELPNFNGDYVMLTPEDLLTKLDTWINKKDFSQRIIYLPAAVENEQLRAEINNYIRSILPPKPTEAQQKEAVIKASMKFPILIDVYIKKQEETGEEAITISKLEVGDVKKIFNEGVEIISSNLDKKGFYNLPENSFSESKEKLLVLKKFVEADGYRIFYNKGVLIRNNEKDLQLLYKLIWRADKLRKADINPETDHGRGELDFATSNGADDKTIIEFKLASNTSLEKTLLNQTEVYKEADTVNQNSKKLYAIVYFTKEEKLRVKEILKRNKLTNVDWIILIDARNDNKPTGSEGKPYLL